MAERDVVGVLSIDLEPEQTRLDAAEARLGLAEGRLDVLEADTDDSEIAALAARMLVAEGAIEEIDADLLSVDGDIASLSVQTTQNSGEISGLIGRVGIIESDTFDIEGDLASLQIQVDDNTARSTANALDVSNLQAQADANTVAVGTAQASADAAQATADSAEATADVAVIEAAAAHAAADSAAQLASENTIATNNNAALIASLQADVAALWEAVNAEPPVDPPVDPPAEGLTLEEYEQLPTLLVDSWEWVMPDPTAPKGELWGTYRLRCVTDAGDYFKWDRLTFPTEQPYDIMRRAALRFSTSRDTRAVVVYTGSGANPPVRAYDALSLNSIPVDVVTTPVTVTLEGVDYPGVEFSVYNDEIIQVGDFGLTIADRNRPFDVIIGDADGNAWDLPQQIKDAFPTLVAPEHPIGGDATLPTRSPEIVAMHVAEDFAEPGFTSAGQHPMFDYVVGQNAEHEHGTNSRKGESHRLVVPSDPYAVPTLPVWNSIDGGTRDGKHQNYKHFEWERGSVVTIDGVDQATPEVGLGLTEEQGCAYDLDYLFKRYRDWDFSGAANDELLWRVSLKADYGRVIVRLPGAVDYKLYHPDHPELVENALMSVMPASGIPASDYQTGGFRAMIRQDEGGYDSRGVELRRTVLRRAFNLYTRTQTDNPIRRMSPDGSIVQLPRWDGTIDNVWQPTNPDPSTWGVFESDAPLMDGTRRWLVLYEDTQPGPVVDADFLYEEMVIKGFATSLADARAWHDNEGGFFYTDLRGETFASQYTPGVTRRQYLKPGLRVELEPSVDGSGRVWVPGASAVNDWRASALNAYYVPMFFQEQIRVNRNPNHAFDPLAGGRN